MKRKTKEYITLGLVMFVVLVAAMNFGGLFQVAPSSPQDQQGGGEEICKDTASTTLSVTLRNVLNSASTETFDATGYIYEVGPDGSENYVTSITDTTSGTATLDCGKVYHLKLVSADGDGGDNSKIWAIEAGPNAKILDNGVVEFKTTSATYNLMIGGSQHGVLEFRAKDKINDAYMYDSGDSSNVDWETDGATFTSTTDNTTPTSVGTGGRFEVALFYRTTATDTEFNDQGYIILLDASTSTWEEPSVSLDGKALHDQKGSLTVYESRAYSDYEYAYIVPAPSGPDDPNGVQDVEHRLDINMKALDGVDPGASDDISVKFAAKGAYLSIDGRTVKYGAAKDDSSTTEVFTSQDVTFDIA